MPKKPAVTIQSFAITLVMFFAVLALIYGITIMLARELGRKLRITLYRKS